MTTAKRYNGSLDAYLRLMRLDKPVGTLLLLWPTLAALFMAAEGMPPVGLIVVFALGTLLMRSAGCVVNDLADRDFDSQVARTEQRPLATGELTPGDAKILFGLLLLLAALLLIFLSNLTRILALGGVALAVIYPFMKRHTYLPQAVLGAAFSWGLLMGFAEVRGQLDEPAWLFFIGSVLWIVAYDTFYAMCDRPDDLAAGIKSTAILFGKLDLFAIAVLQLCALFVFYLLGQQLQYRWMYVIALTAAAMLFVLQLYRARKRDPEGCFFAFKNNVWVGFALLVGVLCEVFLSAMVYGPSE